jgi:hypothetical protein
MGLNASDTPELIEEERPTATSPGHTLFLKIDLEIDAMGGKPAEPMTAVFAPDPKRLKAGDVNVLLWLHGDKNVWSRERKHHLYIWGHSVHDYLQIDECKLREFILQSSTRQFLLVVPTLNDRTGRAKDGHPAGGLLWQQGQAEAFLQQVLNGVKKYMGINATGPGNIVLAAHSGGGHILTNMAQHFAGLFNKVNEIWCFDCTYWGGDPFIAWAKRGHSNNPRLWVYSTGGKGNGSTGNSANRILAFSQTKPPPATNIEVLIDDYPTAGKASSSPYFVAAYHGSANGHYESIKKYLPQLVEKSKNLKPSEP